MPDDRRERMIARYLEEQQPAPQPGDTGRMLALPDGRMAFIPNPAPRPTCEAHSGVCNRMDNAEAVDADHETRIRALERTAWKLFGAVAAAGALLAVILKIVWA